METWTARSVEQKARLRTGLENSLCRIQSHRRGRSSASLPAGPPRYQTLGKIGIKGAREEETRRSTKSFGNHAKSRVSHDGSTSTIMQHMNEGPGMWLERGIERIDRPAVASATSSSTRLHE